MLKRAATMRGNPPEPERRMWLELRDSRFMGLKFRRQYVIGNRIVDFFCPARGLAVEIDGDTHASQWDARRDLALFRQAGFLVIRFTNHDVMSNLDGVLLRLKTVLEQQPDRWPNRRAHHPLTPSSEEEGE